MYARKRERVIAKGRGGVGKAVVMGILDRTSERSHSGVHVRHVPGTTAKHVQGAVRAAADPGARLLTDSTISYRALGAEYAHEFVNHAVEYVRGTVSTNGIGNFWSLLKRTIKGNYVSVDPIHLARYLDEQSFRFNELEDTDYGGRVKVLAPSSGVA